MISEPNQHPKLKSIQPMTRWQALGMCLLAAVMPWFATGCSTFGNGKLVKQLQNENDRLLSEFRAERKKREEAERANYALESRLAESEKLLAQQAGTTPRLSSLPASGFSTGGSEAYEPGARNSGQNTNGAAFDSQEDGAPSLRWLPRK